MILAPRQGRGEKGVEMGDREGLFISGMGGLDSHPCEFLWVSTCGAGSALFRGTSLVDISWHISLIDGAGFFTETSINIPIGVKKN